MSALSKKEKFKVLEMVSEIASEAAKNPNVGSMIDFQNDFIESLYNTMSGLIEDDDDLMDLEDEESDEEEEEEEEADKKKKKKQDLHERDRAGAHNA